MRQGKILRAEVGIGCSHAFQYVGDSFITEGNGSRNNDPDVREHVRVQLHHKWYHKSVFRPLSHRMPRGEPNQNARQIPATSAKPGKYIMALQ